MGKTQVERYCRKCAGKYVMHDYATDTGLCTECGQGRAPRREKTEWRLLRLLILFYYLGGAATLFSAGAMLVFVNGRIAMVPVALLVGLAGLLLLGLGQAGQLLLAIHARVSRIPLPEG